VGCSEGCRFLNRFLAGADTTDMAAEASYTALGCASVLPRELGSAAHVVSSAMRSAISSALGRN
jgi:hypothetical protein